jgi:hypothetical protein
MLRFQNSLFRGCWLCIVDTVLVLGLLVGSVVAPVRTAAAQGLPDLAVELSTHNAVRGLPTYYDIRLLNLGTAPSYSYQVYSLLPLSFTNLHFDAPGFICHTETGDLPDYVIVCNKWWFTGPLLPGQTLTLRVYATAPMRVGCYGVFASVNTTPDGDPLNNPARGSICVRYAPGCPAGRNCCETNPATGACRICIPRGAVCP